MTLDAHAHRKGTNAACWVWSCLSGRPAASIDAADGLKEPWQRDAVMTNERPLTALKLVAQKSI